MVLVSSGKLRKQPKSHSDPKRDRIELEVYDEFLSTE